MSIIVNKYEKEQGHERVSVRLIKPNALESVWTFADHIYSIGTQCDPSVQLILSVLSSLCALHRGSQY